MLLRNRVGWIKRSGSTDQNVILSERDGSAYVFFGADGGSAALDPPYDYRIVIPAQAGIHSAPACDVNMDSRLRGNDTSGDFVASVRLHFLLVLLALSLTGCSTLSFYWQALNGQMEILNKARPIESVIRDRDTKPELKQQLALLLAIRDYASKELKLPDNNSYRSYADLKRPFVIWNVFATTEFSTELTQWCFPVAGCVNYRGYFSQANAERFAKQFIAGDDRCICRRCACVFNTGILQRSDVEHLHPLS